MSTEANTLLQRIASSEEVNDFEIGKYKARGTASQVFEGFGAGAFDRIISPTSLHLVSGSIQLVNKLNERLYGGKADDAYRRENQTRI